MDTALHSKW